jgi:hypothetical protein
VAGAVTTKKERIGWVAATGVGERKTRRALGDQHATRPSAADKLGVCARTRAGWRPDSDWTVPDAAK